MRIREAIEDRAELALLGARDFRELHIDFGCGTGDFLIRAAKEFPDCAFVGLDINKETCRILTRRLSVLKLNNATVINCEAYDFLRNNVNSGSVDGIHIYFPTPDVNSLRTSPHIEIKVRSLLLVREFLVHCRRSLGAGGSLRMATDHLSYVRRARRFAKEVGLYEVPWTGFIETLPGMELVGSGWERHVLDRHLPVYAFRFF